MKDAPSLWFLGGCCFATGVAGIAEAPAVTILSLPLLVYGAWHLWRIARREWADAIESAVGDGREHD